LLPQSGKSPDRDENSASQQGFTQEFCHDPRPEIRRGVKEQDFKSERSNIYFAFSLR